MLKNEKKKKNRLVFEVKKEKNKKYLNLLGFAAKAGKIVYGEEEVINGVEKGKLPLIIVSKDMSEKSKERFKNKIINICKYDENIEKHTKVIIVGTKEENSHAVGKINKTVIGIKEKNLAKGIIKSILEEIDGK